MVEYTLHFDGSCGPKNPGGTAAYGYVLRRSDEREPLATGHGVIGAGAGMTNNRAEFHALWRGLQAFWHTKPGNDSRLNIYGDSNLVIQIMSGSWKTNPSKAYYIDYDIARTWINDLRKWGITLHFNWVPRKQNQECDDLSKAHQEAA